MQTLHSFPFPVTIQTTYQEEASFCTLLQALSQHGYDGLEMNLPHQQTRPTHIAGLLQDFGLRMTWLATGGYARQQGLSLSNPEAAARNRTIDACKAMLDWAAQLECGIIIGRIKNIPSQSGGDRKAWLEDSLQQVCVHAASLHSPVLLEATNRYESHLCNSLQETGEMIKAVGNPALLLLPDTFHMNIEEVHPFEALQAQLPMVPNIHFSDNNRFFPGFGHIDFGAYVALLQRLGYQGTIGLEGNPHGTLRQDVEAAAHFLASLPLAPAG